MKYRIYGWAWRTIACSQLHVNENRADSECISELRCAVCAVHCRYTFFFSSQIDALLDQLICSGERHLQSMSSISLPAPLLIGIVEV